MTQVAASDAGAAPDWATIAQPILCPLCEYDLRGLQEPRCPECGYRFDWPEVLNPDRQRHPYLFEHHPRKNVWSFYKTLVGGMRPARFWTALKPIQPSRPLRLFVYWLLVTMIGLLGLRAAALQPTIDAAFAATRRNPTYSSSPYFSYAYPTQPGIWKEYDIRLGPFLAISWDEDRIRFRCYGLDSDLRFNNFPTYAMVIIGLWPLATAVLLMIFLQSMRRARVRFVHVTRCLVYSSDAIVWAGAASAIIMAIYTLGAVLFLTQPFSPWPFFALVCLRWWTVVVWRLYQAYRRYMRSDHALLTVLSTQVILFLIFFCIVL